jgi:thiamine phosphate synthase YjbQ (UPF0047 family)
LRALGRQFNVVTSATTAATRVNLKNASGVTIVAIGATSGAVTIQEANAASGGTAQNLAAITTYYTQASGVWTKVTQAAGATFTCVTGGLAVAEIDAQQLSSGFTYITASHSAASMVIIVHSLEVQRKPENLVGASL